MLTGSTYTLYGLKLSSLHGDNIGVHIILFFQWENAIEVKTTITLTLNLNVLMKNEFPIEKLHSVKDPPCFSVCFLKKHHACSN